MALILGTRLGPYEVLSLLGAGGMGEVYRARDTNLNRDVALKILPDAVASDADRLARFTREAQTLAALNHPNIAAIYGIEESHPLTGSGQGGVRALVMELVDGEDLSQRIARGAVLIGQALAIATQIAEALEAAHARAIIHRDLKPGNIRIRPDGTVKVLDFGLAKRLTGAGDPHHETHLSGSLTLSGAIVGTPAYMAPEILRGGQADTRSDIFAFGVILFELLTGQHPFQRSSIFAMAEAILAPAPPGWPLTSPSAPPALKAVVLGAIAKEPSRRYQTITELKHDLLQSMANVPPGRFTSIAQPAGPPPARRMPRASLLGAIAVTLALGMLAVWQSRSAERPRRPIETKHTQVTFRGNVRAIALSPDGRTAAFASTGSNDGNVMVQDVAGGRELEIWKGDLVVEIQWMPDGSSVVVSGIQDNALGVWLVPRLGGAARRLHVRGAHISVSPDGRYIALAMENYDGFRVAPIDGGDARVVKMDGFQWLRGLDWGAKTNRLAVLTETAAGLSTVWTIAPDGSQKRRLHTDKLLTAIRWSPNDAVIYAIRPTNETAELIRIDDASSVVAPEVLLTGLPYDSTDPYQGQSSLSTDGRRLLVVRGQAHANLWRIPLTSGATTPTQVTQGTSRYGRPRISPDGKWVTSSVGSSSRSFIMRIPIEGGEGVPITSNEAANTSPAWSRDGRQLAFLSSRGSVPRVWLTDADGRAAAEVKDSASGGTIDWLGDGRLLWALPGSENYAVRDLRTGAEELLLPTAPTKNANGWLNDLRVSPNGQHLAVWWNQPKGEDHDGLWVLDWPSRARRELLAGDFYPAGWTADSRSIYAYEYLGRKLMRVSAATGTAQEVGSFPLGALAGCDVSSDARFALCAVRETRSDAWLIEQFDPQTPVVPALKVQ